MHDFLVKNIIALVQFNDILISTNVDTAAVTGL